VQGFPDLYLMELESWKYVLSLDRYLRPWFLSFFVSISVYSVIFSVFSVSARGSK
jgi:hypothetical protein